jgi:hypothetical protein
VCRHGCRGGRRRDGRRAGRSIDAHRRWQCECGYRRWDRGRNRAGAVRLAVLRLGRPVSRDIRGAYRRSRLPSCRGRTPSNRGCSMPCARIVQMAYSRRKYRWPCVFDWSSPRLRRTSPTVSTSVATKRVTLRISRSFDKSICPASSEQSVMAMPSKIGSRIATTAGTDRPPHPANRRALNRPATNTETTFLHRRPGRFSRNCSRHLRSANVERPDRSKYRAVALGGLRPNKARLAGGTDCRACRRHAERRAACGSSSARGRQVS